MQKPPFLPLQVREAPHTNVGMYCKSNKILLNTCNLNFVRKPGHGFGATGWFSAEWISVWGLGGPWRDIWLSPPAHQALCFRKTLFWSSTSSVLAVSFYASSIYSTENLICHASLDAGNGSCTGTETGPERWNCPGILSGKAGKCCTSLHPGLAWHNYNFIEYHSTLSCNWLLKVCVNQIDLLLEQ